MKTRLLVSSSNDGWQNLALEEFFVDRLGADDALMYFYVNSNAVIIGRSQNPWAECDLGRMKEEGVQLVRRISGGGAVYHDGGNLNFSFVMGSRRYDLKKQLDLVLNAIRELGVPCDFSGRNDLMAGGRKFSGNAFCRRGYVRLHHGTLLIDSDLNRLQRYLTVDARKLSAKGTKSVRSRVCNLSDFIPDITPDAVLKALKTACRKAYADCVELKEEEIDPRELAPYVEKHASSRWRLGETPRFDMEIENRFSWGNLQMLLRLKHGFIEDLDVYSDSNNADLAGQVKMKVAGIAFGSDSIANALRSLGDPQADEMANYVLSLRL